MFFEKIITEKTLARLGVAWLVFLIVPAALLGWKLTISMPVETDILAMLPRNAPPGVSTEISDASVRRLNRQIIRLVSLPPEATPEQSVAAAQLCFEQLKSLPQIAVATGPTDAEKQALWGKTFFDYRAQILDAGVRESLKTNPRAYAGRVTAQIYSPIAGVGAGELKNDPLLLTRARQLAMQNNAGGLTLSGEWLTNTDDAGRRWYFVRGETRASSFDVSATREFVECLDRLDDEIRARFPGAQILRRGALFYSDYAAAQSQRDMSLIGSVSLAGVVFVILFFFRSFRPVWLTLLSVSAGLLTGITAVLAVFGKIHVIALVLSTSIIGVAVDYSLHYLTERMMNGAEDSPVSSLKKLLPALILAMSTTVIAYVSLLIAPFPGLRQLAVCAVSGLLAAFVTVVLWFPFLSKKLPARRPPGLRLAGKWLALWRENILVRFGIPTLFAGIALFGVTRLAPDDDVAKLQGFPEEFRETENRIGAITGQSGETTFFVVHGDSAEETLRRAEALQPELARLHAENKIKSFWNIAEQIPSLRRQRENFECVKKAMPAVLEFLKENEIELAPPALEFRAFTPAQWLASPVSEGRKLLWFDAGDAGVAALIPVNGATDEALMRDVAGKIAGTHWMNRRAEFTEMFSTFRVYLGELLGLALALIGVLFVCRFGFAKGIRCTIPILLAVAVAPCALALTGQSFNLFAMLALILVLGIGIDYTLFFANTACAPETTLMSVFAAAITTQLSFGMLAFGSTPAIAGFGLILATGITAAFLLAPLAQAGGNSKTVFPRDVTEDTEACA